MRCRNVVAVLLLSVFSTVLRSNAHQNLRRVVLQEETIQCVALRKHIQYAPEAINHGPEAIWECELLDTSGRILTLDGLDSHDIAHEFISGVSEITISDGIIGESAILLSSDSRIHVDNTRSHRTLVSGKSTNSTEAYWEHQTRRLIEGDRRILAIRVIDVEGASTSSTPEELSNSIFGSSGNNVVSQFRACSFNKLRFAPTKALNGGDPDLSAAGVYEVRIPVKVADMTNGLVREQVTRKLREDFVSTNLPQGYKNHQPDDSSPFDHVMYCLPPGTDGSWIAYGYENSWLTVYNDKWCTYLSAQMHELGGHNLALQHSGDSASTTEIGKVYGDQSGAMGSLYSRENGPLMCFNGAKSWKLGWYDDKAEIVSPFTSSWSGRVMGISDYDNPATATVLLKIETDTDEDYYLNFNRKSRMNRGTMEGADKVLITKEGTNGVGYAVSSLMAKLSQGETYTIPNFGGSGMPVRIKVGQINTNVSPGFAYVEIDMGCTADSQCQQDVTFACSAYCNQSTNTCEMRAGCNCDGVCNAETENLVQCPSDCGNRLFLETKRGDDNGHAGSMFDIRAKNELQVTGLEIDVQHKGTFVNAFVYTKVGEYSGFQSTRSVWKHVQTARVQSRGETELTSLPPLPNPLVIPAGGKQSFYVTLDTDGMRYSNGQNEGALFASDENMEFFEGIGKSYLFGDTHTARIWSGRINYVTVPDQIGIGSTQTPFVTVTSTTSLPRPPDGGQQKKRRRRRRRRKRIRWRFVPRIWREAFKNP